MLERRPRRRRHWLSGRLLHGIDDLVVAGAATEVAHQPLLDLVLIRLRVLVEKGSCGDDLAGGADAALEAATVDGRLLYGAEVLRRTEALDRGDVCTISLDGERDAGGYDLAVDHDGAGAT